MGAGRRGSSMAERNPEKAGVLNGGQTSLVQTGPAGACKNLRMVP